MIGASLSIYELTLSRDRLEYKPAKELVLGLTSDSSRALTHALAEASLTYNITRYVKTLAEDAGNRFISKWIRSVLTAYSSYGLQMSVRRASLSGPEYSDLDFAWGGSVGLSSARCQLDLNATSYGFTGWTGIVEKAVRLEIDVDSINPSGQQTTLRFNLAEITGTSTAPVANLAPPDLVKVRGEAYPGGGGWFDADVLDLVYEGAGNYLLTIGLEVDSFTHGVELLVRTPDDGIYVGAFYANPATIVWHLRSEERVGDRLGDTTNEGYITLWALGPNRWRLPYDSEPRGVEPGVFALIYEPNANYAFSKWEVSGPVEIVGSLTSRWTWVKLKGGGEATITALYEPMGVLGEKLCRLYIDSTFDPMGTQPRFPPKYHLGNYTISNSTYSSGLVTANGTGIWIDTGNYAISYVSDRDYSFVRWEPGRNVLVLGPPNESSNHIAVSGDGWITAVYSTPLTLTLDSHYVDLGQGESHPSHRGFLKLDDKEYDLGGSYDKGGSLTLTNVSFGRHNIEYRVENQTYDFLGWEIPQTSRIWANLSFTILELNGSGTLTALYTLAGEARPTGGGMSTLYVDSRPPDAKYALLPVQPKDGGTLSPTFALPGGKQGLNLTTPTPAPAITLAETVTTIAFVRPSPPNSMKEVSIELGFVYEGQSYRIGRGTIQAAPTDKYVVQMSTASAEHPSGFAPGLIPARSLIQLSVVATFFEDYSDRGTFLLFYGGAEASRVELYQDVKLTIETSPLSPGIRFQVDGIGPDGSSSSYWTTGATGEVALMVSIGEHLVRLYDDTVEAEGVHLRFARWSFDGPYPDGISSPESYVFVRTYLEYDGTLTAEYDAQYELVVVSGHDTPSGGGWYEAGATAQAFLTSGVGEVAPGTRYVFVKWTGDATGTRLISEPITMDRPKVTYANWTLQHLLIISVVDENGRDISSSVQALGAGWYSADSWASVVVPKNTTSYDFDYMVVDGSLWPLPESSTGESWRFMIPMDGPAVATVHYRSRL